MTAQTVPEGGPLTGLRVLELGTLLAGPFAGRLLGDLGAEVIKVEAPGKPDPIRDWGKARYEGRSLWWPVQSRPRLPWGCRRQGPAPMHGAPRLRRRRPGRLRRSGGGLRAAHPALRRLRHFHDWVTWTRWISCEE